MRGLQLGEKGTRRNLTCRPIREKVPVTISVIHVWLKETHELCRETIGTAPRDQHLTNLRLQNRKSKFIWEESAWWEFSFMSSPAWKATSRKPFSWVHLPIHRRPCYFTRHGLNLKLETDLALLMCHWLYTQAKAEEQWDSRRLLPRLQKAAAVRQYMAKTDASQESPEMLSHEGVYVTGIEDYRMLDHTIINPPGKAASTLQSYYKRWKLYMLQAAETGVDYPRWATQMLLPQMPGTELQGLEFAPIALSLAMIQPFLSLTSFFSFQMGLLTLSLWILEICSLAFLGITVKRQSWVSLGGFERCWVSWESLMVGMKNYGTFWSWSICIFASSDGHKPGARYGTSQSMCKSPHSLICLNS